MEALPGVPTLPGTRDARLGRAGDSTSSCPGRPRGTCGDWLLSRDERRSGVPGLPLQPPFPPPPIAPGISAICVVLFSALAHRSGVEPCALAVVAAHAYSRSSLLEHARCGSAEWAMTEFAFHHIGSIASKVHIYDWLTSLLGAPGTIRQRAKKWK